MGREMNDLTHTQASESALARELLEEAIKAGRLTLDANGRFVNPPQNAGSYLRAKSAKYLPCNFLDSFLFKVIYDGKQVPLGCRSCFKVKIALPNFKSLMTIVSVLEQTQYVFKCGVDFYNEYSRDLYAAYIYCTGLDGARATARALAERMSSLSELRSPDVVVTVKRGCSHFEVACGPSDQWTFDESLAPAEEELKAVFVQEKAQTKDYMNRKMEALIQWIAFAHQINDDTYLEFTGNRPLYPRAVTYSFDEGDGPPAASPSNS